MAVYSRILLGLGLTGCFLLIGLPVRRLVTAWGGGPLLAKLISADVAEGVTVGLLLAYLRWSGDSVVSLHRALHWYDLTLMPLGLWLCAALCSLIGARLAHVDRMDLIWPQTAAELTAAVVTALTTGICEELVLRGFLLDALRPLGLGLAALVSAVAFGAAHTPFWGWRRALAISLWAVPLAVYTALAQSLVPVMLAHALNGLVFYVLIPAFAKNRPQDVPA